MKKLLTLFSAICLTLSVGLWLAIASGFKIIISPSVPMGLWHVEKISRPLRRGDFVWWCPPDTPTFRQARARGYLQPGDCPGNYLHIMKPVAAIPGDTVAITKTGVFVNGKFLKNSVPQAFDNKGRPLIGKLGRFQIQSGTVWLISSFHSHSYDSRYFGPVSIRQVGDIGYYENIPNGMFQL